ncbi:MAG: Ribosomal RNA small subunit methyltransferase G [bacterium ADurb.Bin236]|nr:MAG: Ribosomal RNA small subunit methyltransferase G [bacterium ADurb.Bin236]HOY61654.1 16S rRNA (guanine(527)-N(7))-methyltransferase RsmG [bacterium]HPN95112.1 16S rRNA (guanine(527)-N(7))-methyltransferase RsmG [bacterium]
MIDENIQERDFIEASFTSFFDQFPEIGKSAHAFYEFYLLLKTWNKKINLVSDISLHNFVFRHVLDSLFILKTKILPENPKIVDIGSGAGFPGLSLKIAVTDIKLISIESIGKKTHFQSDVVEKLSLSDTYIINDRAEAVARDENCREHADLVTARAVASVSTLAELALPFVKICGKAVFYKNADIEQELSEGKKAIETCGGKVSDIIKYRINDDDPERCLLILEKVEATPDKYPRKPGMPAKRPIS